MINKNDPYNFKIIDFGISGILSNVKEEIIHSGTMIYSPPEVISEVNLNSNTKIDIWFLGVILFIILTKQYPFIGNHDYKTFTSIIKDKLKFPNSIKLSKEVHNLIHHMLDKNPQHRYLIVEIKLHPWISDYFRPTKISMLSETIFSETSDYYDDTNPDNKFNYSKRMFSDQTLLSKMSTLNRIPSLSPPSNRKSSYKGNMQASNLLNLLISSRKLPEIKDVSLH